MTSASIRDPQKAPEVTVLVAAYNAMATLTRCLDSLCRQTLTSIQVICIDDCSTDGTLPYLRSRAYEDSRIEVMRTPSNSGQAVARNMGLQNARGKFVAMVDADDWLSDDCLERAVEVFERHPQTDCVCMRLIMHYADDEHEEDYGLPGKLEQGESVSGHEAFELCLDGWKLHGLYLARTQLYQQFPFDTTTRLYSDDNTSRLHYLHSREVRACTGRYYYFKHQHSMTSSFNLHRFDFMEANLSMLETLRQTDVSRKLMLRFESSRWMTFIGCYRLFLEHSGEIPYTEKASLIKRFTKVLKTFRAASLPLAARRKPGYWLTHNLRLFDWQQRAYLTLWEKGLKPYSQ